MNPSWRGQQPAKSQRSRETLNWWKCEQPAFFFEEKYKEEERSMLLLLFILSVSLMRAWACPTSCICKWKGGKQSVECINKSLITIPSGMDHGTQVLDFAGNNLDRLLKERFHKMGLINLQKIFLSRCRIKHIEDRAFKGLTNLVELDLSDNVITSVPSETFYDYPSLMRLTLNGNPIRIVKKSSFLP